MKKLHLFALTCLLVPSSGVFAHPREDALRAQAEQNVQKPAALAIAMTDSEPRVRIRGDDGNGLSRRAFTRWISRHSAVIDARRADANMRILASTALPVRVSAFALADRNRDGRISATELADFLSPPYPAHRL